VRHRSPPLAPVVLNVTQPHIPRQPTAAAWIGQVARDMPA
jgi:hypothetical protein